MESDESSIACTPPDVMEIANSAILDLLPQKSKEKYEYAYKRFIKNIQSFSEHAIIAYFAELSIKIKSSTLWSTYSMLRSTLVVKHNVDIAQFQKLRAFPKRKSVGYQPKKSKIFMKEHVEQFILEAPHEMFLTTKNFIRARRFFIGDPIWTPFNRPAEAMECRKEYVQKQATTGFIAA